MMAYRMDPAKLIAPKSDQLNLLYIRTFLADSAQKKVQASPIQGQVDDGSQLFEIP